MGARGPLSNKQRSAKTATGTRLKQLPAEADAIFRRLVQDVADLEAGDAAIVEDTARWLAIAKAAYADLYDADGKLSLTVTDTAHGNKEESRKNPLLIVLRTASEQIRANVLQLGATPMARARLPERAMEQGSFGEQFFQLAAQQLQAKKQGE